MNLFKKFPSFDYILKSAKDSFLRFPFTLICAVVATVSSIILIELEGGHELDFLEKIMIAASLGLPLFTALACYADKNNFSRYKNWGIQSIGLALLMIYYLSLPPDFDNPFYHIQRYLLLNICFHFLVAFLPYFGGQQVNGFWQYNKSLFLRFLTAFLYSVVLYIGLAIALAALDYLFGVTINKLYFELWVVIVGIFNTWFFLAGIPNKLDQLNDETSYPKGLKIFTQYILLPLVALYFLILISYEIKILIEWNWPKGWVSQLVLWYSVVGILSLLLLHPLRDLTENKWIKVFSRWFFRALVPLVAMLFLAILVRVSDYGFTENRYFVLAMAVGLSIVVLYFIISRKKDIRVIPIVICVIAFLSAYGPFSAFSISKKSQQKRLQNYLTESKLFINGKIQENAVDVSEEIEGEMSSIVRYLNETHGTNSFSQWLPDSLLESVDTVGRYSQPQHICELMGFKYMPRYSGPGGARYFNFSVAKIDAIELSGYDYMIEFDRYNYGVFDRRFKIGSDSLFISYDKTTETLNLNLSNDAKDTLDIVELGLIEPVQAILKNRATGEVPLDQMSFDVSGKKISCKFIFRQISGTEEDGKPEISLVQSILLLKTN
jgi:hypothetical protein